MTNDERQLAELLHRTVPEPPRSIDLSQVVPKPARRPRTTWIPAIAAACVVVLLCVTVYLISRPDKRVYPPSGPGQQSTASSPSPSQSTPGSPLWQAQLLAAGNPSAAVVSLDGKLYRRNDVGFSRLDPTTGQVLASYPTALAWPPVYAGNNVWAAVPTSNGYQLEKLNPATLREEAGIGGMASGVDHSYSPILAASSDGNLVALGVGPVIYEFNAHSDEQGDEATVSGQAAAIAFSPDNATLYVAHQDPNVKLAAFDVRHQLHLLDDQKTPDGDFILTMAATSGGLWFWEKAGIGGSIKFAPGFDLTRARTIASASGGVTGFFVLGADTMWLAGNTELACADPATGAIRAKTPVVDNTYVTSIAPIDGRLAVTLQGTLYRISYLTPPSSCG